MADYTRPCTPKRRQQTNDSTNDFTTYENHSRNILVNPTQGAVKTPRLMELTRTSPPVQQPETNYDSVTTTSSLHQHHPTWPAGESTRSTFFPGLGKKPSTTTFTSGLHTGRTTPALPTACSERDLGDLPPPSTSSIGFRSTLMRMFSKTPFKEPSTGSRTVSRQSQRPKTPSRSISRLDDRASSRAASRLDNNQRDELFDIHEAVSHADAFLLPSQTEHTDDQAVRPQKSWTNLFRAKSPTFPEPGLPLDAEGIQENFSRIDSQSNQRLSRSASRKSRQQPGGVDVADIEAARLQSEINNRIRRSYGNGSAPSLTNLQTTLPAMPDIQALTTDTWKPARASSVTVKNFSLPMPRIQRTTAREAMEFEGCLARVAVLEEDMEDLKEKLLELEILMKSQQSVQREDISTVQVASMYDHQPPRSTAPSHLGRDSHEESVASTWQGDASSDIDTAPTSRSSSPDLVDTTLTSVHKDDTLRPTSRLSQNSTTDYSPSAKVYKMFVRTKDDMQSLQRAVQQLKSDAASSRAPTPEFMTIRRTSSLYSPPSSSKHNTSSDDPFILSDSPDQISPTTFNTFASTPGKFCFGDDPSALKSSAPADLRRHSQTYHRALAEVKRSTSQRTGTSETQTSKRSSAVIGTAQKARQVLGAQAIEIDAVPVRKSSKRGLW